MMSKHYDNRKVKICTMEMVILVITYMTLDSSKIEARLLDWIIVVMLYCLQTRKLLLQYSVINDIL